MIKIFISHSNHDSAIAKSLAELFRNAMNLTKSEIRCTSVDGYRLPAGANTDEQLRREVIEAPVLVGLISQHSFESAYVLFELGARWGKNAYMAPVLASGQSTSILKGPLTGINALRCESASQVHQLVDDIASQLNIPLQRAADYQEYVEAVVACRSESTKVEAHSSSKEMVDNSASNNSTNDEYSNAEEVIKAYCESQWGNDYQMRAHCIDKQWNAVEQLRHQTHTGVPADVFDQIRAKARQEWPDNFEMRLHTENKQIDAYRKVYNKK